MKHVKHHSFETFFTNVNSPIWARVEQGHTKRKLFFVLLRLLLVQLFVRAGGLFLDIGCFHVSALRHAKSLPVHLEGQLAVI